MDPHRVVPAIRDGREVRVHCLAKAGDEVRQRIGKIFVFAPPEAVPCHDDVTPEAALVVIEAGDECTFVSTQEAFQYGPAVSVEIRRESRPIEILHARFDGVGKKVGAIWIGCYAHFAYFMHLRFKSMLATWGSRGRSESCFQIAPMIASRRTTKSAAQQTLSTVIPFFSKVPAPESVGNNNLY